MFRFHTGSIKSVRATEATSEDAGFDSHTGSIKSQHFSGQQMPGMEGFDSILVRLKVKLKPLSVNEAFKFRFHTGSIKSLGFQVITSLI